MQAAILAGGLATRLGELTRNLPKSMVSIQGKPFLEYQLELLKKGGMENIVLCLGHQGEQIERHFGNGSKYGIDIKYSFEDRLLGTAGALKKAEALLDDTFFTIYGDVYLFLDFSRIMCYFESQYKLALMTVYKNYDQYDRSNTAITDNLVVEYSKNDRTRKMVHIDYGASIFRKEALDIVPENQFCSLEEFLPSLIERRELLAYEVSDRFYEIGSPQGLKECTNYIEDGK
ncbi:sugar phosphate nucleotidyltransferase [Chloroflexota bacterium]